MNKMTKLKYDGDNDSQEDTNWVPKPIIPEPVHLS
jgi:hypothetical protein